MSEYDLSDEAYDQASSALEDVLSLFEERVNEMILEYARWSPDYDNLIILDQKFPKLTSSRNHIQCCNPSSTLHPPNHSLLDISKLISFGEKASDFRRRASEAQQFNNIMRGIFESLEVDMEAQTTQVFQHGDSHNDEEIANKDIYQAHRLCDTTKVLFETMGDISNSCRAHSAFIHLSGFRKPEIGMIMSICGGKDKKQWHQVYWTNEPLSTELTSSKLGSVCSELKQLRKFKNPLCVHLQRNGSWKYAKPTAANRKKTYSVAPVLTLEELLSPNQEKAKATASSKKLLKKDKLDLAVEIARSLLYSFGSPLLQETWKPENIHVSHTVDGSTGDCLRIQSYISRDLNYDFSRF